MKRIRDNVGNLFKAIMKNTHLYILLLGGLVLYLINYHPNISKYWNEILQQLNGVIIAAIFTSLIVDGIIRRNTEKERKDVFEILESSMVENLFLITKEFHDIFINYTYTFSSDGRLKEAVNEILKARLIETFKEIKSKGNEINRNAFKDYLKQLASILNTEYLRNVNYERPDKLEKFFENASIIFKEYRYINVSNFLAIRQDENKKIKTIINLNITMGKVEKDFKYFKNSFASESDYEENDSLYEEADYDCEDSDSDFAGIELLMSDENIGKWFPVVQTYSEDGMKELYYFRDVNSEEKVFVENKDGNIVIDNKMHPGNKSEQFDNFRVETDVKTSVDVIIRDFEELFKSIKNVLENI